MEPFSKGQFEKAHAFLKGKICRTPLLPFHSELYLKAENLQPSGSFKIRGATYCVFHHTKEEKERGVIAYSTGNHAKAVAFAAKMLGLQATIVMSPEAPQFKIEAVKRFGAEIIMADSTETMRPMAEAIAANNGPYLISPYDHHEVILGQGTIGIELLEEIQPKTIFVPVGGGGLIGGIAAYVKAVSPQTVIIGVKPKDIHHTIADAVKIPEFGRLTKPLIDQYVDEIVTVSEEAIKRATIETIETSHLFIEPSGALSVAAALETSHKTPAICLISGGNTTVEALHSIDK